MPVPGGGGEGGGAAAGPLSNGTARAVTERSGPECGEGERGLRGRVPSPALSSGPGRYAVPSVPSGAGGAPTPAPLGAGGTQGVLSPPPPPRLCGPLGCSEPLPWFRCPPRTAQPRWDRSPETEAEPRAPSAAVPTAARLRTERGAPRAGAAPPAHPPAGRGCVGRAAPSEQLSGTQKPLLAR